MPVNLKATGRAAAAALALSFVLPGVASVQAGNTPQGIGGVSVGKPDITAAVGYVGLKKWTDGGTVTLDHAGSVQFTQAGPQNNMCRFKQMDLQPKNAGPVDHGAFVTKVYRDGALVHTEAFAPASVPVGYLTNFRKWRIDLKEGMNTVKVFMDADKEVAEMKESNNNYTVRFNVKFDCNGDGHIGPGKIKNKKTLKKGHDATRDDLRRPKPGSKPGSKPGAKPSSKPRG